MKNIIKNIIENFWYFLISPLIACTIFYGICAFLAADFYVINLFIIRLLILVVYLIVVVINLDEL